MERFFFLLGSYLLGAIPSGFLIAKRFYKTDIRRYGSGNPGAANVYRSCGKAAGFATFVLDTLKGYLPVYLALSLDFSLAFVLAVGFATIVGHIWTIFLGFKGGKGVATSAGVFACLTPLPTLFATGAFLLGVALTDHISIGSILAAIVMPIASFTTETPRAISIVVTTLSLIILIRHIPNIKRIMMGKEFKISLRHRKKL